MKKILLLSFFQFIAAFAFAQEEVYVQEEPYFDSWRGIYLRVGVNQSGARNFGLDQQYLESFTGFHVGLGINEMLQSDESLWFNGEIGMSQQGFKVKDVTSTTEIECLKLLYVNVPVVLKYYPFPQVRSFYLGAGPQIGFLFNEQVQTGGGADFDLQGGSFAKVDFTGVGVAGFNFARQPHLGVEVRYLHGLSKFMLEAPEGRHSVFQFSFFFPAKAIAQIADVFNFPFKAR